MHTKTCIECNSELPVDQFYRHPGMNGGRLNKCMTCTKEYQRERRLRDPKVREYDRVRAQTPKRRELRDRVNKRWRKAHPEAYRAHNALNNGLRDGKIEKQPCQVCATTNHVHAHHNDYHKPLDVVWLCAKCHHRLHALFPQLRGHKVGAEA